MKCRNHEGICLDCERILSDPQPTPFGTMCHTCKATMLAEIIWEMD